MEMNQRDLDRVAKDMDRVFEQMNNAFKKVDADLNRVFKQMEDIVDGYTAEPLVEPWEKWFAWRPVKVKGKTRWMKNIYRRYRLTRDVNRYVHKVWEYGDIFDVLKDAGK